MKVFYYEEYLAKISPDNVEKAQKEVSRRQCLTSGHDRFTQPFSSLLIAFT